MVRMTIIIVEYKQISHHMQPLVIDLFCKNNKKEGILWSL